VAGGHPPAMKKNGGAWFAEGACVVVGANYERFAPAVSNKNSL